MRTEKPIWASTGSSLCAHFIPKFFRCFIVLFPFQISAPGSPGTTCTPYLISFHNVLRPRFLEERNHPTALGKRWGSNLDESKTMELNFPIYKLTFSYIFPLILWQMSCQVCVMCRELYGFVWSWAQLCVFRGKFSKVMYWIVLTCFDYKMDSWIQCVSCIPVVSCCEPGSRLGWQIS